MKVCKKILLGILFNFSFENLKVKNLINQNCGSNSKALEVVLELFMNSINSETFSVSIKKVIGKVWIVRQGLCFYS